MIDRRTPVILYGGAFNPPTIAHTQIAQALVDRARQNGAEVWIMLSGERADKAIKAPLVRRMAYVAAMLESCDTDGVVTHIETGELLSDEPTETIETVKRLADEYPERRFTWVFGADSVGTMKSWRGGEWMFDSLDMLLVAREGFTLSVMPRRATMLGVNTAVTSSTEVRQRMADHLPIDSLVTGPVKKLLFAHG